MMRLRALVVMVVAAMALSGCSMLKKPNEYVLPGGVATGSDGYQVSAEFENVENLVPNSRVLYNNVPIGTVTHIAMKDWHAEVTMKLKKDVPLTSAARFKIGQASLLGSEYVEVVDPPQGSLDHEARLKAGDRVTSARTGNYPETEDVLASVSLVLNGGGLAQLRTITTELDNMIGSPESQQNARQLIDRANVFVASLDRNKRNIVALIDSIDRLAAILAKQRTTVSKAIDHITPGLKVLNRERVTLVRSLERLGDFGTIGSRVISESGDELVANLRQLEPVLTKVQQASKSIPNALMVAGTFPFPLPTVAGAAKGDYMNLYGTVDLSLPQLTANFIGGPADVSGFSDPGPAFQKFNPFTGPLDVGTSPATGKASMTQPLPTGSSSVAGAATPGSLSPSGTVVPGPTATSTTPPTSCGLLSALLGGC